MANKTQTELDEKLKAAKEALARKLDHLTPFLPPPDKFPTVRQSRWRRNAPRQLATGKCKATR
jgi:hypothetical protein